MNTARKLDYDYYDQLARKIEVDSKDFLDKDYKKQSMQAPYVRVLNALVIFALVFVAVFPLTLILSRYAAIHERQYEIYRLKVKTEELATKTSEIKERLESGTSLDDLEIYATERVGMVKADKTKVIVLKSYKSSIKTPRTEFSISSGAEKRLYASEDPFEFLINSTKLN